MIGEVSTLVTDLTGAMHAKFGPASKDYFAAKKVVTALHRIGNLGEKQVHDYAVAHKAEETTIALSLLCKLPIDVVERAVFDRNHETAMILAKALDLSWTTTMAILFLGAPNNQISASDLDEMSNEFAHLDVETSTSVLRISPRKWY